MKITYFGNFKNKIPTIDEDILYSLKKGNEVKSFDLRDFDDKKMLKIIKAANESDLFLFHGTIADMDDFTMSLILQRITVLLDAIKCKKVMWFLDKVVGTKVKIIMSLVDKLDYIFVSDDTWLRRFESDKIFPLHPGCSEKPIKGRFKKELECDIAFAGSLYGERVGMYEFLKKTFGERFKMFDDKYGKDYADLCKSAKVIIVPQHPFDDFFWSDRIYTTMKNGGVVVHPRTQGIIEEGFEEGKHYFNYYSESELYATLKMLISKENKGLRKMIGAESQYFVNKHFTYSDRIDEMLKKI